MIEFDRLLRKDTRKPLVKALLRNLLKQSMLQRDSVIRNYLFRTSLYCFKKEKNTKDLKVISDFLNLQDEMLTSIKRANLGNIQSSRYLIDLSYGQVCFTPRHDHFIQARYLHKLPLGKKSILPMPFKEDYSILGPNPIPIKYLEHINSFLKKNPELKSHYESILKQRF